MCASWPAFVQQFDVPIRVPFFQHDNMASKGGRDDSTRSKKEKPSYDGKVSSWPAFRIKGENYIHLKGWAPMVLGTAPSMTKWYVTKVSTGTSSKGTYTSEGNPQRCYIRQGRPKRLCCSSRELDQCIERVLSSIV